MSDALLVGGDRLLILAPHPDDESIATGGLVQFARDAGAAVRVVVLTDGDNNPWPQRWIEKRWRIDAAARARWGARRREEARVAMRTLGLLDTEMRFLGLPDLGLTDLLMQSDRQVIETLRRDIDEFLPTLVVLPSLADRHPDHSAAHILTRLALDQRGDFPRLLTFAVHGGTSNRGDVALALDTEQRDIKRAAILCHDTQMRLSRRRFLRYAGASENFQTAAQNIAESAEHPLSARFEGDRLHIHVDLRRWAAPVRGDDLFVALGLDRRLLVPLESGEKAGSVGITRNSDSIDAVIECKKAAGYVKLARAQPGWRVFDSFGWQVIRTS